MGSQATMTDRGVVRGRRGWALGAFAEDGISEASLVGALARFERDVEPRFARFWAYYRNPLRLRTRAGSATGWSAGRWYSQAQEAGLPGRLMPQGVGLGREASAREVVIENDIAWRIQAMVDFMFGKPIAIESTAGSARTRQMIERVLDYVWERSGGIALLQDMGVLGHVYGHVDLVLRCDATGLRLAGASMTQAAGVAARRGDLAQPRAGGVLERVLEACEGLGVEVVDPARGVPILDERDFRRIRGYVIRSGTEGSATSVRGERGAGWLEDVRRALGGGRGPGEAPGADEVIEVLGGEVRQIYERGVLVHEESHGLTGGRVPVAHVQNISQPFAYEGYSDVEPLIPLQDELNTRLSDRASRVTMQSFKMYLAKGVEGFDKVAVGPGQVWYTDNMEASIQAFGGDADSPSEARHIQEVREALDKVSNVPPLAGGVVQGRIGSLSSANALRITLMGLLAKTERKRVAYGRGIAEMSRLILTVLDNAGVMKTSESDRGIRIRWADPLPVDAQDLATASQLKESLGVAKEKLAAELGYRVGEEELDVGVT